MVLSELQASFSALVVKPWFAAGYVAGSRPHGQSVMGLTPGEYPDGSISTITSRVGRNISDRVLMANVPGDALANSHHFAELLWKKGFTARRLCQALEHSRVPVRIFFVEYPYGVNDRAGLSGEFHELGQAARAGIVTAITDDDQHFPVPIACPQLL